MDIRLMIVIVVLFSICIALTVVVVRLKQRHKQLLDMQLLQSEIQNKIPDLLWFKDPNGVYMFCNQRFEAFFGAKEAEIVNKTDYDFVDKELADMFRENDLLAVELKGASVNEEEVVFASDGHKEILETIKTPIYNESGELLGVLGIGRDITSRKKSEQDSRNSQEMLQMVMDSIPQFIFWKDIDSVYLGCNSNFANAAGVGEPENIVGKTDYDLPWKKEEADFFVQKDKEVIASKTPLYHIIEEQKQADGKAAWLDTNKIPMYSDAGEVVGTLGTFEDITERKKNELELKEANKQLSEATKELKKSNKELELALEEAKRSKELEEANVKLEELNIALNNSHDETTKLYKELVVSSKELEAKNTELHDVIQNLKETQMQLLQADKMASLGILTAGVAHEINNPLNYISGGFIGVKKYFDGDKAIQKEHIPVLLESIQQGVERATDIVKGLSQFSRDNKDFEEECDIHSILDNCLVMLHNRFKHKVKVSKNYCEQTPKVRGNVGKIHQVMVNVLSNAESAIKESGEVMITTSIEDENVVVEIEDNGCGISKANLKHVTDPFFTTKLPGEGTGLGLSITHSIIADHKGTINFKSKINEWTKVVIALPQMKE